MPERIVIRTVPPDLIERMRRAPELVLPAIARAMDEQNQLTVAHIQARRMSGQGPYPVEEHRLGVGTRRGSRLWKSLRASKAVVTGGEVQSGIGSNVKYAGIHEFGGTIHFPPRAGSVRLRTSKAGALLLQPGRRGAIFAKASHARARTVAYQSKGHDVTMPARAPITFGIKDRGPAIGDAIIAAAIAALGGAK